MMLRSLWLKVQLYLVERRIARMMKIIVANEAASSTDLANQLDEKR